MGGIADGIARSTGSVRCARRDAERGLDGGSSDGETGARDGGGEGGEDVEDLEDLEEEKERRKHDDAKGEASKGGGGTLAGSG